MIRRSFVFPESPGRQKPYAWLHNSGNVKFSSNNSPKPKKRLGRMHEKKGSVKFIDLLSKRPSRRCLFPGLKHGGPRAARVPLNTDLNS